MARGPLFEEKYRPLFSGHETFPLRYGWLKKAFDAVTSSRSPKESKQLFLDDKAISEFGVGRNMVASIRHWATCCGVIEETEDGQGLIPTAFGNRLFGPQGFDPYLEDRASLWLLHWNLCSGCVEPIKTTWFWAFSHFPNTQFRREDFVIGLMKLADSRSWSRVSKSTVQRDVECFVRTYEAQTTGVAGLVEDCLESPLAELGLIKGHKGNFQFLRGEQSSLTDSAFALALDDFWQSYGTSRTLSFEAIAYAPGSPGRVFLLDESGLAVRLLRLEDVTNGHLRWSETAGLKQVLRDEPLSQRVRNSLLGENYRSLRKAHAA